MRHPAKCRGDWLYRYRGITFLIFNMAAVRHLGFLKLRIFNDRQGGEGQFASSCQILRRSVKPLMMIYLFSNMAAVRHLGFVVQVIGPLTKGVWWSLSLCKIWLESMQQFR